MLTTVSPSVGAKGTLEESESDLSFSTDSSFFFVTKLGPTVICLRIHCLLSGLHCKLQGRDPDLLIHQLKVFAFSFLFAQKTRPSSCHCPFPSPDVTLLKVPSLTLLSKVIPASLSQSHHPELSCLFSVSSGGQRACQWCSGLYSENKSCPHFTLLYLLATI